MHQNILLKITLPADVLLNNTQENNSSTDESSGTRASGHFSQLQIDNSENEIGGRADCMVR